MRLVLLPTWCSAEEVVSILCFAGLVLLIPVGVWGISQLDICEMPPCYKYSIL